jgi:hypothetical protein
MGMRMRDNAGTLKRRDKLWDISKSRLAEQSNTMVTKDEATYEFLNTARGIPLILIEHYPGTDHPMSERARGLC